MNETQPLRSMKYNDKNGLHLMGGTEEDGRFCIIMVDVKIEKKKKKTLFYIQP